MNQDEVIAQFTTVWGIGPVEALKLYKNNCYTLTDLQNNLHLLKPHQQIGLKYHEDLQKKIPRSLVTEYLSRFSGALNIYNEKNNCKLILCPAGSYRREQETCGDIDCIVYESDINQGSFQLVSLIDFLREVGLLLETLSIGDAKYMGLCKVSKLICRIDICKTTPKQLPYALLTYTGNKMFNIAIRQLVKHYNCKLSQHGLFPIDDNTDLGSLLNDITDEKDIFKLLEITYIPPKERQKKSYNWNYCAGSDII